MWIAPINITGIVMLLRCGKVDFPLLPCLMHIVQVLVSSFMPVFHKMLKFTNVLNCWPFDWEGFIPLDI